MNKRGVVIYPTINKAYNYYRESLPIDQRKEVHIEYTSFAPTLLRLYVLYWDVLDWPKNNLIDLDVYGSGVVSSDIVSKDENLLISEGLLKRSNILFPENALDAFVPYAAQAIALIENNKYPGEEWTLAQNHDRLILPQQYSVKNRAIEIELYQSIPVPIENVPMEEVLEFKQKRIEELYRFRHSMDRLYLRVIQSGDISRAKTLAIDDIQEAVSNLNRVIKEARLPLVRPTFKVELNISDLVIPLIGTIGAQQFGYPLELGAILGLGLAAALKVKIDIVPTMKHIPQDLKDYAYLCYLDKEIKKKKRHRRSSKEKTL